MNAETAIPPEADPDLEMGLTLQAVSKRARRIQRIKVSITWVVLVAVLAFALMQMRVEPSYMIEHYGIIIGGVWMTIKVSFFAILFATILALLGSLGRVSSNSIAQGVSGFYVSVIRGTPLLIQIYIIYLGLPQIGVQIRELGFEQLGEAFILTAFQSGVLALSLNYGGYMTEIFRAGLQSVSHGQREAALAVGMTNSQMLYRIILPQAIRTIIPDIGNQFIAMQKDSALVSVMGVWEITYLARRSGRIDSKYMEMFLIAAALYWMMTIVSSWLQNILENRMAHAYER